MCDWGFGAAIISGGASLLGAKSNSKAIDRSTAANERASQEAIAFQRETRDMQRADFEPFRQDNLNRVNALGEIFGFDAVGQGETGARPVSGGYAAGQRLPPNQLAQLGLDSFLGRSSRAAPGENVMNYRGGEPVSDFAFIGPEPGADGTYRASYNGATPETMTNPGSAVPVAMAADGGNPAINEQRQQTGRERFEGSLFNDALQGVLGQVATGIDANFAASGDVYSGANLTAKRDAASNNSLNAVGMWVNGLMGAPSTAGAAGAANAAGQYGANAANIALQQGQNASNSAFLQAQNNNALINNLSQVGQFALGNWGGGGGQAAPSTGGGGFNFGYSSGPTLFS